jgi:NAD(P)-dependent dehydrogenase (short-subunit alcohol dehydrogenase family)
MIASVRLAKSRFISPKVYFMVLLIGLLAQMQSTKTMAMRTTNAMVTARGMRMLAQSSGQTASQGTDFALVASFRPSVCHLRTQRIDFSSSSYDMPCKKWGQDNRRKTYGYGCRQLSSSTSSDFEPSERSPPFTGMAMFEDIDLTQSIVNSNQIGAEARRRNEDPEAIFVVTGASRGIGCQYVKTLLERTKGHIIACCRSPDFVENDLNVFLQEDGVHHKGRVTMVKLDVEDQGTVDALSDRIKRNFGGRVDGLLNVAGLLGDGGQTTPGPERSVSKLDRDWVEKSFMVNTIGPMMMCHALAPYLKVSSTKSSTRPKSIIVNISARVGSISDNGMGGWYSYRASKAALNQFTRTLALEVTRRNQTWVLALHPGTTNTDLSAPFQKNVKAGKLFPVEFTVGRMLDIVDCMEERHSGGFYDWDGKALPY